MKKETNLEGWQLEDAQRLRRLFDARQERGANGKQISQMEFGEKYEIGTQGMVWQYLSGRKALNLKSALAFSRGLGVKVRQFSPTLADQIEAAGSTNEQAGQIQLAASEAAPTLQWVSPLESELLSHFRSGDKEIRERILTFARSMTVAIGRQTRTDET